jgi:hypothetical protein
MGTFEFEKETKNTVRYFRYDDGRQQTIYVPKSTFDGIRIPKQVEFIVQFEQD